MDRNRRLWVIPALLFVLASPAQEPADTFDYSAYDGITRAYVNDQGYVDYRGLKQDLPRLKAFVDRLAATGPSNHPGLFPDDEERKRYYLTAYNAWVLYVAASAYPKKNALWNWLGLFRNHDIVLGGQELSLNELEHGILRKEYRDPRIHFYINCAARSCPPLPQGAIPRGGTEAALEAAARRFLNDPRHVRFDSAGRTLYLSRIFDWFEEDFIGYLKARGVPNPSLADYAVLYLAAEVKTALERVGSRKARVRFIDYDKSLNEQ